MGNQSRLEVGRIDKAHGVLGEVLVTLTTNRDERVAPGALLFAGDRTFVVESSRPHQHRFLVRFEGIFDRNAADGLRGTALSADPLDDPDEVWVHDLVGCEVVDTAASGLGTIEAVEVNPASDLLVLEGGHLIPMTFFVEQRADGAVVVDPPDGLFDI